MNVKELAALGLQSAYHSKMSFKKFPFIEHRFEEGFKNGWIRPERWRASLLQDLRFRPASAFWEPLNILVAVLDAVGATRLTERKQADAAVVSNEKFDGVFKWEPLRLREYTSLALFADDVERVLCDLYGGSNAPAAHRVRNAVFHIMALYTESSLKELWDEHRDADCLDAGYYEQDEVNSLKFLESEDELLYRRDKVRGNPAAFSKYTVQFVQAMEEKCPKVKTATCRKSQLQNMLSSMPSSKPIMFE